MLRLIVNPDTPNSWTLELVPGEYRIGRSETNQLALDHSSVSSEHCSLTVSHSGAVLKDLGSTAGTFVNGELVEMSPIVAGTTFRVGEVEVRFEAEGLPAAPNPAQPQLTIGSQPKSCKSHPRVRARHFCAQCQHSYCDLCVETRYAGRKMSKICRQCGQDCSPISASAQDLDALAPSFYRRLPTVFGYPLQGNGLILILAGGAIFTVLGWLPWIGMLITGYIFNYAQRIVTATAAGEADPPDWPDFTNWWEDVLVPLGHLVALIFLTFGPAILLQWFFPSSNPAYKPLVIGATLAGAFLAPMGVLALSMFDTVSALNPVSLVWSILRIPTKYFVAATAFVLVVTVHFNCDKLLGMVLPYTLLVYVISGFINLYLLAVSMRIVGLLYASEKERLGWFNR